MPFSIFKKTNTLKIGPIGEKLACDYLIKNKYKILETNYTNKIGRRLGEIDIIAMKEKSLIFVEVKTRVFNNNSYLIPEENIDLKKLRKLSKISQFYLKKHSFWDYPNQFDAISIILNQKTKKASLRHLKNIFI